MSIDVVDDHHPMMREAISTVLRRVRPGENTVDLDCLGKLAPAGAGCDASAFRPFLPHPAGDGQHLAR